MGGDRREKDGAREVGGGLALESGSCIWGCGPDQYLEIRGFGGAECRH